MTGAKATARALSLAMCVCASTGCGFVPAPVPRPPGATPIAPSVPVDVPAPPSMQAIVLGEMCPDGAAGRPALAALIARKPRAWTAAPDEIRDLVIGRVRRWTVLGFTGRKAGNFTSFGPVDLGTRSPVLLGGYAGASPCGDETEPTNAECTASQHGCGLAFGSVDDEHALPVEGGACVDGQTLVVDVDGHGDLEAFPLADLAAQSDELVGQPVRAACSPRFGARAVAPGVDLLGVIDLDGDGRREVIVQVMRGGERAWLVYSPITSAARLTRIAIVAPWAKSSPTASAAPVRESDSSSAPDSWSDSRSDLRSASMPR